jgi:regulatory protein
LSERPGPAAAGLKARAVRYLSQREHSRVELERKLLRAARDLPQDEAAAAIGKVLDELQHCGLLSDERAAAMLLAARGRRHGELRLRQDLRQRGLAPELVAQTLHGARETELARAQAVWRRRFGAPPADAADRARQARFLAGRGFLGETIVRVLRDAGDTAAELVPGDDDASA